MKKSITSKEAKFKMAAECSMREKCAYDIHLKLQRWELPERDIAEILAFLEKQNYINEERFCSSFVHDKFQYNKWGCCKIKQALRFKKVNIAAIQQALDEIDKEDYNNVLRKLLLSKKKQIKASTAYERKTKLLRFAVSRGFEMDVVLPILDQISDDEME